MSHYKALFEWFATIGDTHIERFPWCASELTINDPYRHRSEAKRTYLHADPGCTALLSNNPAPVPTVRQDGVTGTDVEFCTDCSWKAISDGEKQTIVEAAFGYKTIHSTMRAMRDIEVDRPVLQVRSYLHGLAVKLLADQHERHLGRYQPIPELDVAATAARTIVEETREKYPFDFEKAVQQAVIVAADSLSMSARTRRMGTPMQGLWDLHRTWILAMDSPADIAEATRTALRSPEADEVRRRDVDVDAVLVTWTAELLEELEQNVPAYYIHSITDHHYSDPGYRTALLETASKVRGRNHGFGVLPAVVISWLEKTRGERSPYASLLDAPYQELDQEAWETAMMLWETSRNDSESIYSKAAEAVAAAPGLV